MEDDLLVEDDLRWKTTFGGIQTLVEDDHQWKSTFGGRRPLVENNLQWKTNFGGRLLLVKWHPLAYTYDFGLWCIMTTPNARVCRKEDILRQNQLNHYNIGVGRGEG